MFKTVTRCVVALLLFVLALLFGTPASQADEPTQLRIAIVLGGGIENAWDGTLIRALEQVKEQKPHGLDLSWTYTDPLWGDDAENAMRIFAESGEYDIIWAHASYSDQVEKLMGDFPEILFVVTGSGNTGLEGNQYWLYKRLYEPAYVLGVLAGRLTESNVIGLVGTFAADDVNDQVNSFFAGARSVNPNIKQKVSFIDSWYDNAKAAEYTNAQVATGADVIFMLAGNFQPCQEHKIPCFGNGDDQSSFAPDVVASSATIDWRPDVNWIIDEWWKHKTTGAPYAGNKEPRWVTMGQGGVDIAPYHEFEGNIPQEVKDEVAAVRQKIISGELVVPFDTSPASSQ